MEWMNIHTSTMTSEVMVDASPANMGTWLRLLHYCCAQENNGLIAGAKRFDDRKWLKLVGVSAQDVAVECGLWSWQEDTLVLAFYPSEKQSLVQLRRKVGRDGGRASGKARKNTPPNQPAGFASTKPESFGSTKPETFGRTEGKGREGKGMEWNGSEAADPLTDLPAEDTVAGEEDEQQVGQFAEWPTREEWFKAAAVQGLPVALAEMEWLNQERKPPVKRWAGVDRTRLQQHASFVLGMARQRGQLGDGQKKSPARPAGSTVDVAAAMAGRVEDVARVAGWVCDEGGGDDPSSSSRPT